MTNHAFLEICSKKCEIVHVLLSEVIFDRNGAKVQICKKSTSSLSEKIRERGFLKSSSHSRTAGGLNYQHLWDFY